MEVYGRQYLNEKPWALLRSINFASGERSLFIVIHLRKSTLSDKGEGLLLSSLNTKRVAKIVLCILLKTLNMTKNKPVQGIQKYYFSYTSSARHKHSFKATILFFILPFFLRVQKFQLTCISTIKSLINKSCIRKKPPKYTTKGQLLIKDQFIRLNL